MKKQFSREERLMKSLLKEAGTESPSSDFKDKIMMKLEAREIKLGPYKPLISRSAWAGIALVFIMFMTGVIYFYSGISISSHLNFDFFRAVKIPRIELSRNMQYAIAFVALFFLQIPWLKRIIDREYKV